MNPFILPASTVTTAAAGAVTVIIVWALKQFTNIDVPNEVASAFTTVVSVLAAHFTTDNPSITASVSGGAAKNEIVEIKKGE